MSNDTLAITPGLFMNEVSSALNDSSFNKERADIIKYAINNDVVCRDYLLGIANSFTVPTVASYMTAFIDYIPLDESAPARTILSALHYELGDKVISKQYLDEALNIKPDYSLALLIRRVISAGWASESFGDLRKELHGKVIEQLLERSDLSIEAN